MLLALALHGWHAQEAYSESAAQTRANSTQQIVGYVTGPNNVPVSAARIRITRTDNGPAMEIYSDGQGFFQFTVQAGPGIELRVEADGYAPVRLTNITLSTRDKTRFSIRLVPTRAGVGEVTELAEARVLDSSLGVNLEPERETQLLPQRTIAGLLQRVPGYSADASLPGDGFPAWNAPSFHGSTGAEQRYLLDDFDVTHPLTGLPAFDLPAEMVRSLQVVNAGASGEDDGFTGSVVQTATHFGGNRLGGTIFLEAIPYREAETAHFDTMAEGTAEVTRHDQQVLAGRLGLGLGGFLVRDRLWFYAAAAPEVRLDQVRRCIAEPGTDPTLCTNGLLTLDEGYGLNGPAIARVTFNITPDQTLQLGAYGQGGVYQGVINPATDERTGMLGDVSSYTGQTQTLNWLASGRYVLRLPAIRTRATVVAGYLSTQAQTLPDAHDRDADGTADGDQSATYLLGESEVAGTECYGQPCTVEDYQTGGPGELHARASSRLHVQVELQHRIPDLLGSHFIRWGLQGQSELATHTWTLSGGNRYYLSYVDGTATTETLDSFTTGSPVERPVSSSAGTRELTFHLQDAWRPFQSVSVRFGTRFDSPRLLDSERVVTALSPRASLAIGTDYQYRFGDLPGGLGASFATQHQSVPLYLLDAFYNTPERTFETVYLPSARSNDATLLSSSYLASGVPTPSSAYHLADGLELPTQRVVALQWQQELPGRVALRLGGVYKQLRDALTPMRYAEDEVYLGNPGDDPDGAGPLSDCIAVTLTEGTSEARCFQAPTRLYRALEVQAVRTPTGNTGLWLMASYVLSQLTGNYEGPIPQAAGQEPIGLATGYNPANLATQGTTIAPTDLPTDRRHRVRGELAFDLPFGLRVGAAGVLKSGTPVDLLARSAQGDGGFVYLLPRGTAGRTGWVLEESLVLQYRQPLNNGRGLSVSATLLNPWQAGVPLREDSLGVLSAVTGPGSNQSSVENAQATAPCVNADGSSSTCIINSGYRRGVEYPSPRQLQLSIQYSF